MLAAFVSKGGYAMDHSLVDDLLAHPKIIETQSHIHHGVAKYDHLLRVTRYSYKLAVIMRADVRVCTRAGMIHDIDSRYGNLVNHGAVAARWAAEYGEDTAVCEAIVGHMYPLGPAPTTREGWILSLADKAASVADLTDYVRGIVNGRSRQRKQTLQESDPFYRPKAKPNRRQRIREILDIDV
jgi:glycyl-tRNA synthetase beta chain/uncharacterized protein